MVQKEKEGVVKMKNPSELYPQLWSPNDCRYQSAEFIGHHVRDFVEYEKEEVRRLIPFDKRRNRSDRSRIQELLGMHHRGKVFRAVAWCWRRTFSKVGEDWAFLAMLGFIVAVLFYLTDVGIALCTDSRIRLYRDLTDDPMMQFLAWIALPIFLILFSTGFSHLVSPQSIGSGIPEMKTILRGVNMKEYLTFKTLVAKCIGLTATLGSGMPLGMEGPFVHIAAIVAEQLSKLIKSFNGMFDNESRHTEMLAAACAVGVGTCFAAPVGGVMFSIEVTTTYFAVRNYFRGFFGAVCGATFFRLLVMWFHNDDNITVLFATHFNDFPYNPQELIAFAVMGVICGLGGAFYVWLHRQYVFFTRKNKIITTMVQKNRFLYPGIVAFIVASMTYPNGLGRFIVGDLSIHDQIKQLFSHFPWTGPEVANLTSEQSAILSHWTNPYTHEAISNVFCYFLYSFIFSIITLTLPVPSGSFIPVLKIGAGLGRLCGELMYLWFPEGVSYGGQISPIVAGGYSVVGAAAFAGAATHTVSVAMIVFEMTGQISHLVPVMIAVLISNAVAALLQPSLYDSMIKLKNLPYMPDILPRGNGSVYNSTVSDFMRRDVKYIWNGITYEALKDVLKNTKNLRSLPLVDSPNQMILLGSVQRLELIKAIDEHIGHEKRLEVAAKWKKEADEREEEERIYRIMVEKYRHPSRFESAPDIVRLQHIAHEAMIQSQARKENLQGSYSKQPTKSILKKNSSFTNGVIPMNQQNRPLHMSYSTFAAENRARSATESVFRKSKTFQNAENDPELGIKLAMDDRFSSTDSQHFNKKVQLPSERVCDMSPEDQQAWEKEEMAKPIDLEAAHVRIDPSPFQLVERTSLLKVHYLFSMTGINHAYVTNIGRLVGVVAMKELRKTIEEANSRNLLTKVQAPEETLAAPANPAAEPLLKKPTLDDKTKFENTEASVDSLYQSENGSTDAELDNIRNNLKLR